MANREVQITYGSSTFGASGSYLIDGKLSISREYPVGSVEFDLIVTGSSESAFGTNCAAVEQVFRTPRQKVVVKFGSSTHVTWDPAANTGFNARPTITKAGSPADTGRSRRYHVRIEVDLPADLSGQNGRQEAQVTLVTLESGRRRAFFSGVYTALGSNSARAQYAASVGLWTAAQLTAFGGTWEGPFDQQATADDTDKRLSFSEAWEELIYDQSLGTLDDLTIRRQKLEVRRTTEAPGDSAIAYSLANRLQSVEVSYECAVDKARSQDLPNVYATKIKPFLISVADSAVGGSIRALVSQTPTFNYVENTIAVQMSFLYHGGSDIIYLQIRVDDAEDTGKDIVPVWDRDRYAKYNFQGPATLTRTITEVSRTIGSSAQGSSSILKRRARGRKGSAGGSGGADPFGIFGVNKPLEFDFGGGGGGGGSAAADSAIIQQVEGDTAHVDKVPEPNQSPDGGTFEKVLKGTTSATSSQILGKDGDPQLTVVDSTTTERYEYIVVPKRKTTPNRTPTFSGLGGGGPSHPTTVDRSSPNLPGTAR